MNNEQLTKVEQDIKYCIDSLDLDDNQIGEMLRTCEKLGGISAEYFCEEFIIDCEDEDEFNRLHSDEYLQINWRLDDEG